MKNEEELFILEKIVAELHKWERETISKARVEERPYQWGYSDGIRFAKQVVMTAQLKAEKNSAAQLAQ